MAKLDRKKQKIFGSTGDVAQFGQIGSDAAGSPTTTKDIDAIQSLGQYLSGLFAITANLGEPPRGQDINALYHLITRQLAYLFEAGIPEWEVDTEYSNLSSFVSYDGDVYVSLSNDNIGNTPAVGSAYWRKVVDKNRDAETVDGIDSTRIPYGDGQYASTASTNADTITKSGVYVLLSTASNIPTANTYVLWDTHQDSGAAAQIALAIGSPSNLYVRSRSANTWTAWFKVWNASNDGTGSGLDADTVRATTPGAGGLALLALSALGTNWPTALTAALGTGWATTFAGTSQSFALNGATGPGDYILPGYASRKSAMSGFIVANDASSAEAITDSTSYAETQDAFRVGFTLSVRVVWCMGCFYSGKTAYARIYVNGSAVDTEASTTSTEWIRFTRDISLNAGDIVEVRMRTSETGQHVLRSGFCLCGNGYGRKYIS